MTGKVFVLIVFGLSFLWYSMERDHERAAATAEKLMASAPVYTAYGSVISAQEVPNDYDGGNHPQSIIGFACDNGSIITFRFATVEPRLRQGLRARIVYKPLINGYTQRQVVLADQPYFLLVSAERLDR